MGRAIRTTARRNDAAEAIPGSAFKGLGPIEIFEDIEQQSEEWFTLRLGTPTASVFSTIMAQGKDGDDSKGRTTLLYKLAGEKLTGKPAEGKFITPAMERGNAMEPEARAYYERTSFEEIHRVGFVRRKLPSGTYVGASPDALVGKDRKRGLEIKTMAPHLMIERLMGGATMPMKHRAQVQGTMWIANLESVDLLLFYSGMPVAPKFTVERDDPYIKTIATAIESFDYELRHLVETLKKMGRSR